MVRFRTLQATYMPVVAHILSSSPPSLALEQPEVAALYLPSELSTLQLSQCSPGLVDLEIRLREAQCGSSLERLRDQLFIKTRFLVHKGLHLRHQAATTRARALLDRNERKIRLHAEKYRDARAALLRQHDDASSFEWEELKQEDIRCMEDPDALEKRAMKATPGESRRKLSWIWMAAAQGAEGDDRMHDGEPCLFILFFGYYLIQFVAVRVEWCKAWARSRRWTEEVNLLLEEMRRVVAFHEYKVKWWKERCDGLGCIWPSVDHAEGARAYASEHAAMHEDLITQCKLVWDRERKMPATRIEPAAPKAGNATPNDVDLGDSDSSEDVVEDIDIEELV